MTDDQIDAHLDAILRASGSALKHFTLAKPKDDMRAALRAALAAPEAAEPPDLWAVHIPGPDDLHAAPSNAEAIDAATAHNAAWRPVHAAQVAKGNEWPPIECTLARVIPWPLDAEEHADSLKEWKLSDWIAPTDSQAGRDAVEARRYRHLRDRADADVYMESTGGADLDKRVDADIARLSTPTGRAAE